jgi:hypothetical protein
MVRGIVNSPFFFGCRRGAEDEEKSATLRTASRLQQTTNTCLFSYVL